MEEVVKILQEENDSKTKELEGNKKKEKTQVLYFIL